MGAGRGPSEDVGHGDLAGLAVGLDGSASIKGVWVEEGVEGFGVVAVEAVVVDVEVGEERLVEQPT